MRLPTVLLALAATGATAQTLQDPTRPPAQLLHPAAAAASPVAPRVQSILIGQSTGGRRVAVVDGNLVRVGDRVDGARVVAISAGEVHLQRAGGRDVLKLQAPATEPGRKPE